MVVVVVDLSSAGPFAAAGVGNFGYGGGVIWIGAENTGVRHALIGIEEIPCV